MRNGRSSSCNSAIGPSISYFNSRVALVLGLLFTSVICTLRLEKTFEQSRIPSKIRRAFAIKERLKQIIRRYRDPPFPAKNGGLTGTALVDEGKKKGIQKRRGNDEQHH